MTEREQVEYIIQHLGFAGATKTLRITKERLIRLRDGDDGFTYTIRNFAKRTIEQIDLIKNGYRGTIGVELLFVRQNGVPHAQIDRLD